MRARMVHAWLKALSARCNPSGLEKTHSDYADAMGDMLDRIPLSAFTPESYRWIASECQRGAPNAAQLKALLNDWQRAVGGEGEKSREVQAYIALFKGKWSEVTDKKTLLEIAKRHYPSAAWDAIKAEYGAEDPEREADEKDRKWWEGKIRQLKNHPSATYRWRTAMGMRELLLRPLAFPRPWAIEQLTRIANTAQLAGADTNGARVKYAPDLSITEMTARARGWTMREEKSPDT